MREGESAGGMEIEGEGGKQARGGGVRKWRLGRDEGGGSGGNAGLGEGGSGLARSLAFTGSDSPMRGRRAPGLLNLCS